MNGDKSFPAPRSFTVGDILRCPAYGGGFRVWKVVGVHLGATNQEGVYRLEVLSATPPGDGPMYVPTHILEMASHVERV